MLCAIVFGKFHRRKVQLFTLDSLSLKSCWPSAFGFPPNLKNIDALKNFKIGSGSYLGKPLHLVAVNVDKTRQLFSWQFQYSEGTKVAYSAKTHIFLAPESYTAGISHTDSLNSA